MDILFRENVATVSIQKYSVCWRPQVNFNRAAIYVFECILLFSIVTYVSISVFCIVKYAFKYVIRHKRTSNKRKTNQRKSSRRCGKKTTHLRNTMKHRKIISIVLRYPAIANEKCIEAATNISNIRLDVTIGTTHENIIFNKKTCLTK